MPVGDISFAMEYRGIKRVGGKGYENKFVIVKRKRKDRSFFLFLLLFGGAVYLIASVVFHSLFHTDVRASRSLLF